MFPDLPAGDREHRFRRLKAKKVDVAVKKAIALVMERRGDRLHVYPAHVTIDVRCLGELDWETDT